MKETPMEEVLEALCTALEDELSRQEQVLALCMGQRDTAQTRDLDGLNTRTLALESLILDSVRAGARRAPLLEQVVGHYQLPVERQTLSELVRVTPEPWRARLLRFQDRVRNTLQETRGVLRANAMLFRQSLRTASEALGLFEMGPPSEGMHYDVAGLAPYLGSATPARIDQRG